MDTEASKQALRVQFEPVVDALGYKFTTDGELVDFCLEQIVVLHRRHGIPFCPCKGLTDVRDEDMKKVCPCIIWNKTYFDKMKRCWCGLFIRKEVDNPDDLPQIPESELME